MVPVTVCITPLIFATHSPSSPHHSPFLSPASQAQLDPPLLFLISVCGNESGAKTARSSEKKKKKQIGEKVKEDEIKRKSRKRNNKSSMGDVASGCVCEAA